MKYCTRCLQPNTRPNTKFNENGLCPACNYVEHAKGINWKERVLILKDIFQNISRDEEIKHHCLIE